MSIFEGLILLIGLLVVGMLFVIWIQLCVLQTVMEEWRSRLDMQGMWATELQAGKILDAINRLDFIPKWKPGRDPY